MFLPVHVALPYVADGRLNMLAAGGIKRADAASSAPSLAEATGIRDIDTDIWYALYAPSGTPRDVITKLNLEVNALLKSPEIADAIGRQGMQPTGGAPEQLDQLTRADLERWTIVVREAGIRAD